MAAVKKGFSVAVKGVSFAVKSLASMMVNHAVHHAQG
tara:strand:+ start:156 stop:266 length:111 start_codon:yes stop_codon:yes gene_type:complete